MWESPWPELASQLLPRELTAVLGGAAADVPELVVVPDGPLAAMPFTGLRLPDGRALLEAARVRMLPSLSLVETSQERPAEPRRAAVVVTHLDGGRAAGNARLRIGAPAAERAGDRRSTFEAALRAPRPRTSR